MVVVVIVVVVVVAMNEEAMSGFRAKRCQPKRTVPVKMVVQ